MSTARARWSDAEKKAVLDCYAVALDAVDFFSLLKAALGASYFRRSAKAYLTFLNESLLPKTDPRRPVYQSLLEANQKEIAAAKAAEEAAKLAAATPTPAVPFITVTPAPTPTPPVPVPVSVTPAVLGPVVPTPPAPVVVDGPGVETLALSDPYNWVETEVDVVPRVLPRPAPPPSLFKDPQASATSLHGITPAEQARVDAPTRYFPTLNEALAATAEELAQSGIEAITARIPEFAKAQSRTACVLLHNDLTDSLATIMKGFPDIPATQRVALGQRINDVKARIQDAFIAVYNSGSFPLREGTAESSLAEREAASSVYQKTIRDVLATDEGRKALAASMARPLRGAIARVSAEPVSKPVVTPDPTALVPRHYPPLPSKGALSADDLAQVFGLARTKVVDAITFGFIPSLDGSTVRHLIAQGIHDAMSEGHTFSEACRLVNPNSTGLLPMEALIEKVDPETAADDQCAELVPGLGAGKVALQVDAWEVTGGPMNPKSVAKMADDLNAKGPPTTVEVLSGPPSLFQGGEVFPVVQSVEVASEPAKTVEAQTGDVTPGGEFFQYAESTRVKLTGLNTPNGNGDVFPPPSVPPTIPETALGDEILFDKLYDTLDEIPTHTRFTLEAVRDGVITTAQGLDILEPSDTNKAVWALSLLASRKITVVQCDRLLFVKSIPTV